jgi:hypothetical protein
VDAGSLGALQNSFLTNTLLYHVSNGDLPASQIANGGTSASALTIRRFISRGNDLYINGSKIILTDVKASNGTVHAIDKVMIATGVDIVASAILLKDAKVLKTDFLSCSGCKIWFSSYFLTQMQTLPSMLQRTLHLKR